MPLAFLIDLDGTLVDTLGDFVEALARMSQDLQLPAPGREFVGKTVGRGSEHLLRSCLAHVGADAGLYETAWQRYQAHYGAINGEYSTLFPGVREGLAWLRAQGLPMACLTNKPSAFAKQLLARKSLDGYFDRVFGGDDFARQKPDPMPLLKTCEALGVAPERSWMVGDSSNDAQAAKAAGCPVVLMRYGYNHGEPIAQVPALAHLDRLDQIGAVLARRAHPTP